jgi:8-oxo-dGTP diphosphatase
MSPLPSAKLAHTLCFCLHRERVLMLFRHRPPCAGKWNGLGGKLEPGETPTEGAERELREEAGVDLARHGRLTYAGVLTWLETPGDPQDWRGTHVYTLQLADDPGFDPELLAREIDEGVLAWKPLAWATQAGNREVVDNLPVLLSVLLGAPQPLSCAFKYRDGHIESWAVFPHDPALSATR